MRAADAVSSISGLVMEQRSGTPNVVVVLCDGKTGLPLTKEFEPFFDKEGLKADGFQERQKKLAVATTDDRGRFQFTRLPAGTYRLMAQKWTGPYLGLFEKQGTVIQLLGTANNIKVPQQNTEEQKVVLTPPGNRILDFQQKTGNNATLLVLSTQPPEFDPILGFDSLGQSFLSNVVGVHRMLLGKTTVLNAPNSTIYGFLYAADNSPGSAQVTIAQTQAKYVAVPAVPFIAGWSDGKKTPEGQVAKLINLLTEKKLTVSKILEIPELSNATFGAYQKRMARLREQLSKEVTVVKGVQARVGDLLAAQAYLRLMQQ
jgi:hypothetical protein